MKAIIIAGGKGERLKPLTDKIPKPMLKIGGIPCLEHQIKLLKRNNINDIVILTAYLSEKIEKYFKDGKKFGVNIKYARSKESLKNANRVKLVENQLNCDFIVLYGDVMVDMDVKALINFHKRKKSSCTICVHPNNHPQDSDLIEVDQDKRITKFFRPANGRYYKNLVSAGLYVMSLKILKYVKTDVKADFGKDIFPKILKNEKIFAYKTSEYLKDMGTFDRLKEVKKDYNSGKISRLNKKNKRSAIFLDRDGVINKDVGLIFHTKDFKLFNNAARAIKKINGSEFLAIVVTNQPAPAHGLCSVKDIEYVHNKMETLLGEEGAKLDEIYYCPHHPGNTFSGGNKKYKIKCSCRKPKTGMIMQAKKDFNIDIKKSYILGDFDWDILAGRRAGLTTIGIGDRFLNPSAIKPDYIFKNIGLAVNFLIK